MLSAIMTKPDLAEACFLIAVLVFGLGIVLTLTRSPWPYIRVLDYVGLALVAFGFLAL